MADISARTIASNGLWRNNPALIQMLGLCPLLAVTTTVINGLGLGLATTTVLVMSNVTISALRRLLRPEIRIPIFVLVIATCVTSVELAMSALLHDLYKILGIFVPLIVTNCAILARAETFASRHNVRQSLLDGISMGAGFTLVLVALGGFREVLAQGTLFAQAEILFGPAAEPLTVTLIPGYSGFLLAALPPGAFLSMGLLIALKNLWDSGKRRGKSVRPIPAIARQGAESRADAGSAKLRTLPKRAEIRE
jgi:electron transport complex protein RnfE